MIDTWTFSTSNHFSLRIFLINQGVVNLPSIDLLATVVILYNYNTEGSNRYFASPKFNLVQSNAKKYVLY